jgi:CubicO group peptidase (beta-lactamase class C family)
MSSRRTPDSLEASPCAQPLPHQGRACSHLEAVTPASTPARGHLKQRRPRAGRRHALRWGAPGAVALIIAAAYGVTAFMGMPSPLALARIAWAKPSQTPGLFPSRRIAARSPRPWSRTAWTPPSHVPWKGEEISLAEFRAKTHTNALLVLRGGALASEWYAPGVSASTRLPSYSVAKSVVSLLVGQAIAEGRLHEDQRLVSILPELRTGTEYDQVTLGHLLDMTSGVEVDEEYTSPFSQIAQMYLTRDLRGFISRHRTVRTVPGAEASYRSVDTELLGLAVARVEGRSLAALVEERLWGPLGAESSATWNLDRPGGVEKAFCCLNATARDFARLGQVVLDRGAAGGRRVLDPAWVRRISTPSVTIDDWRYSAQWWHPAGSTGDFSAVGVHGQYIYVDPAHDTVVVKLSDHGEEQDEQATIEVFRALARG